MKIIKKIVFAMVILSIMITMSACFDEDDASKQSEQTNDLTDSNQTGRDEADYDMSNYLSDFNVTDGYEFITGQHARNDFYGRSFSYHSVSFQSMTIYIEDLIYQEIAPEIVVQKLQTDLTALLTFAQQNQVEVDLSQPVEFFLVHQTVADDPVTDQGKIYCSLSDFEASRYRQLLSKQVYDLHHYWQSIGLSRLIFEKTADLNVINQALVDYFTHDLETNLKLLSFFPAYFIPALGSEQIAQIAEESAYSLTAFLFEYEDAQSFFDDTSCLERTNRWLDALGVSEAMSQDMLPSPAVSDMVWSISSTAPLLMSSNTVTAQMFPVSTFTHPSDYHKVLEDFFAGRTLLLDMLETQAPLSYPDVRQQADKSVKIVVEDNQSIDQITKAGPAIIMNDEGTSSPWQVYLRQLIPVPSDNQKALAWLYHGLIKQLEKTVDSNYLDWTDRTKTLSYTLFFKDSQAEVLTQDDKDLIEVIRSRYAQLSSVPNDLSDFEFSLFNEVLGQLTLADPDLKMNQSLPLFAIRSIAETAGIRAADQASGNQLSGSEAMVFTGYLIDIHGLDEIIQVLINDPGDGSLLTERLGADFETLFTDYLSEAYS